MCSHPCYKNCFPCDCAKKSIELLLFYIKMVVIRPTFSLKRAMILLTLMSVLLLSVVKLRNLVPVQWKNQKAQDILKSLLHWQWFSLDSVPIRPINSSFGLTDFHLSEWQMKKIGHYRSYYMFKVENQASEMKLDQMMEMEIYLNYDLQMSDNERNILLYTFYIFQQICGKHHFDYFAIEGTLLGVYRHMGLIPWDDDMDVIMDASKWTQIRDAFSGNKELGLQTVSRFQWKIFLKSAYQHENKNFKWPFVDIFFYRRDETNIIGLTPSLKPNFIYKTKDIFPVISRPFETFQIYVPRNINKIVEDMYNVSVCQSPGYIHKLNLEVPRKLTKSIPCSYLYNLYPFVFRSVDQVSGKSVEKLKLGSKIISDKQYD